MSDQNNSQGNKVDYQTILQRVEEEQPPLQPVQEKPKQMDSFSNLKMNDLMDFDKDNSLDIDGVDQKVESVIKQAKQEKESVQQLQDKLMQETLQLGLHKKKPFSNLLSSSKANVPKENIPEGQEQDFLFKKLEKKWGLDKIDETEDEKAFMKDLLDKDAKINLENIFTKQTLPQSEIDAREKFMAQHTIRPQNRKNITEYNARYTHEIDPMMQGSHLDLKNEETPKMMRYMDEFREFRPQINIGERWGQIIQQSAINRIQYEQQISKGGNLISYMAKTGKLGVDLYFIVFGITAVFIIPYMVYQHQKQKINYVQKTKNINPKTVPDFYYTEYDLDEISVQKSFYNQYTDEIMEEKNKKLRMHKEIQQLTSMLFSNK